MSFFSFVEKRSGEITFQRAHTRTAFHLHGIFCIRRRTLINIHNHAVCAYCTSSAMACSAWKLAQSEAISTLIYHQCWLNLYILLRSIREICTNRVIDSVRVTHSGLWLITDNSPVQLLILHPHSRLIFCLSNNALRFLCTQELISGGWDWVRAGILHNDWRLNAYLNAR